jgi:hypothetical protein
VASEEINRTLLRSVVPIQGSVFVALTSQKVCDLRGWADQVLVLLALHIPLADEDVQASVLRRRRRLLLQCLGVNALSGVALCHDDLAFGFTQKATQARLPLELRKECLYVLDQKIFANQAPMVPESVAAQGEVSPCPHRRRASPIPCLVLR